MILQFPSQIAYINGEAVNKPSTHAEYLKIVKRFLTKHDYEELLCSIMDEEYYNDTESQLKKIVDFYYSFER